VAWYVTVTKSTPSYEVKPLGPASSKMPSAAQLERLDSGIRNKDFALLADVMRSLRKENITLDIYTYNRLIKSLCEHNLAAAYEILPLMRRSGMAPSEITYTTLLHATVVSGDAAMMERFHKNLAIDGVTPNRTMFNTIIANSQDVEAAVEVLRTMGEWGIEPDVWSYNALIKTCAKDERAAAAAFDVFGLMRQSGVRPDAVTYSTLITACSTLKDLERALELLQHMRASGVERDVVLYTNLIVLCFACRRPSVAHQLLDEMRAEGVAPNEVTAKALIQGYLRLDNLASAVKQLHDIEQWPERKVALTSYLYSRILHACADADKQALAFQIFADMRIQPCSFAFSAILRCSPSLDAGRSLWARMLKLKIRPNSFHYVPMVALLCDTGQPHEAFALAKEHLVAAANGSNDFSQLVLRPLRLAFPLEYARFFSDNEKLLAPHLAKLAEDLWPSNLRVTLNAINTRRANENNLLCPPKPVMRYHLARRSVPEDDMSSE